MLKLIATRCGEAALSLLIMSSAIFLLGRLTGDPVALLLGDAASDSDRQALTRDLGLDQPLWSQFGIFLVGLLRGDLGRSLTGDHRAALDILAERLPYSLELAGLALVTALAIGIPLGVMAAVNRGNALDALARAIALVGQSLPTFWLGSVLMLLFGVYLGWLPTSGYGTAAHYVLPVVTMSLFTVSAVTRLMRNGMIEALGSDYVKFARLKGLAERDVIWRHAASNSLIPVITFMGAFFATMITGAVVIETVFSWPGVGRLAYEAILRRDFPVVQAVVLAITALYVACNLVVDLLYLWADPRMRQGMTA